MELSGIGPQALRGLHEDARQRAAAQLPRIATECLAAALAAWCEATDPGWREHQYDPVTAHQLARCLGLLPLVQDEDDARLWLSSAREFMRRHFEAEGVL